jgi:alpha-L-fucosidase
MRMKHQNLNVALMLGFSMLFIQAASSQSTTNSDSMLVRKQLRFKSWGYGMFLHFNMGTYVDKEWATGHEDPLLFRPTRLDCSQWTDAAKAMGMKYAVLTVKHTGGWCLWDSKYTAHDVTAFKNYKNGKGDIVREFVDACRKSGIKIGLYYCLPGDFSQSLGNSLAPGQNDLHGLPPEAEGDFEGFVEKQVTELLSNYGPIDLMWFDQYTNKYTGKYWQQLKALVNTLQPACVVVANNANSFVESDVIGYEYPWRLAVDSSHAVPPPGNTDAAELCDCIDANGHWFWHAKNMKLKEPQQIAGMLKLCNARGTNLLLDVPPNKDGIIEDLYIRRLMEVKDMVNR